MRRLADRYIVREILPYLLMGLAVLTVLLFASQASEFSELFIKKNVPPALVRTLLYSLMPRILVLTLPVSLLIAVMTGLGRMSADNETTALLASGISCWQMLLPILGLGVIVASISFHLVAFAMPRSFGRFRAIRAELILQGMRTQVRPRVFDDRFADKVLYIGDINRRNDVWDHIFLAISEGEPAPILITAERGILELGDSPDSSQLKLLNGVIHKREFAEGRTRYDVEAFANSEIRFDTKSKEAVGLEAEMAAQPSARTRIQLMTIGKLRAAFSDPQLGRAARVEFHKRLALSCSSLIFAVVGVGFGVWRARHGRGVGFALSIGLIAAYYLLLLGAENLARTGAIPAWIALWSPNVALLGVGIISLTSGVSISSHVRRAGDAPRSILAALARRSKDTARWFDGEWQGVLWKATRRTFRARVAETLEHRGTRRMTWPRLADRYLSGYFLGVFITLIVGFWMIFLVFTLFELSSDILANNIAAHYVAEYLFFITPSVLSYVAPPSTLVAALVTFSVLGKTSEVVALRAGGVSVYRAALPVLFVCAMLSGATAVWQYYVVPDANARQDQLRFYIKKGRFPSDVEISPDILQANWVWSQESPEHGAGRPLDSYGRIFHFRYFDRQSDRFDEPLVVELRRSDFTISRRIEGERAHWDSSRKGWVFENGFLWEFDSSKVVFEQRFEQLLIRLDEDPGYFKKEPKKPDYMNYAELAWYIQFLDRGGFDTTELRVALERKNANAVACLVMGLLGIPFGLTFGRRGGLQAIGIGICLGLIYWLLLDFFAQLGKYGYFSPLISGWSPNGLLAAVGTYLLFRTRT